ncbi:MAG: DUF1844 domain-containing protein [Planctomycetota bacterium]
MTDQPPKIIVDDDWKSQARAEKERLAEQDAKAKAEAEAAPKGPGGLPEQVGFDDLVRLLATQSLMYLGAFPDPQTGQAMVALDVAKLNIDLLAVLQEKTRGNLAEDEQERLDGTVSELRVQFVEVAKAVKQASDEGRLQQSPGGPGPGPGPGMGPPMGPGGAGGVPGM